MEFEEKEKKKKYSSKFEVKSICMNNEKFEKISKIAFKAIKENKFEKDIASQIKKICEEDEILNKKYEDEEENIDENYKINDINAQNINECIVEKQIDENEKQEKENNEKETEEFHQNQKDVNNIQNKQNEQNEQNEKEKKEQINNSNPFLTLSNKNIGSWQCIVGKHFAFSINYQFNCMIYFQHKITKLTLLIYKSL